MPITQYHNRAAGSGSSGLPVSGRLYKGDPKTANKPGADRDFFRFEPEQHPILTPERLTGAWVNLYGKEPQVIRNVQFASDAIYQVFDEWMEAWGKSGSGTPLINRRCDGQTCFTHRLKDSTLNRQPQPCICAVNNEQVCKQSGRLMLFLPELCAEIGALGLVMLITHSTNDLDNIRGTLDMMHGALGRLRNMAFILFRREETLTTPAGLPVKKFIVFLEADEVAAQHAAIAAGDALKPQLPASQRAPSLPAQTGVIVDLQAVIFVKSESPDESESYWFKDAATNQKYFCANREVVASMVQLENLNRDDSQLLPHALRAEVINQEIVRFISELES